MAATYRAAMRRQDIQLLALARQGDAAARCEAGRRYLLGIDGFAQHIATGLDYLGPLAGAAGPDQTRAATLIAECLPLETLVALQQDAALALAAARGSPSARLKLGLWRALREGDIDEGWRLLEQAARGGPAVDAPRVVMLAAQHAADANQLKPLLACLCIALRLSSAVDDERAALIVAAVRLAEAEGQTLHGLPAAIIEAALDLCAQRGDRDAAYALGRALCGIDCGAIAAREIAPDGNLRKGVALLLRAADAGCEPAWLHLYRMHGDSRVSVANPQMARFCLEKAARSGQPEAQRKLGALLLRAADRLADSEAAIGWLHAAAAQGDAHADTLLRSLVLPLSGDDAQAAAAIEQVRQEDPWLALRLQLARHFGLTKLEALCVDPVDGLRPWGLVVGKNPFISQIRLSAARAIPALGGAALDAARRAAAFFGQSTRDAQGIEGDLRRRSLRQRRLFERLGLDESMFFASATAMTLDSLRLGPKWAFRTRQPLQLALAA